jgi:hypothetical protein
MMLAALKAFGRRNVAFVVFTALLFPFAFWLESIGKAQGPDRGAGYMTSMAIWALAAAIMVAVNGVLVIVGIANKRPIAKAVIGACLPFAVVVVILGLEDLF